MRVSPDCFAPPPEANEDEDDDAAAVAAEVVVVVMMVVVVIATVATVMAMAKAGWWYPRGIRETRGPAGSAGASDLDSDRGPGWRSKDFDETSLERVTSAWRAGAVSNLDYILELNRRAGRSRGDRGFTRLFRG